LEGFLDGIYLHSGVREALIMATKDAIAGG
jgi:hypothetical protein